MNRQEKAEEIASLKEVFKDGSPTFVLAYRGLTVNQVVSLRKKVRGASSRYRVVKNRLALRSLKETPLELLSPHFEGPTAIAYVSGDPVSLAKVLDEFARGNEGLSVKAGFVDGRAMSSEEFKILANLPSREILVARFIGALQAPISGLLRVMTDPARALVRTLDQIAMKKESAGGGAATGTEKPPQP